ncbi:OsmC family protein [Aestuariirhabdus sp. Z084]|uniref:OsmC family protein n=1 Tax=Aestuariirhabdus haliotis TaxID=2918751 RepID=UPI00201B386D|nr:OsmC family protein [Aestuariirhabdus haliotis]MCL6416249.1 OsmC family protein [Aestuariirhabdus haliotis]MCL6420291.1 OsmC family protein [Aestuariirhabdus haliotis]
MSDYVAKVIWKRDQTENYIDNQYSRGHRWEFDGGVTVPASSSPHVVPLPYSVEANVDPEEAFVACLSSCHMLFFLSIAAKRRFVIDQYEDNAIGTMAKDAEGNIAMTRVLLRPKVRFSGQRQPSEEQLQTMHHQSHQQCFIANSVKTEVVTEIIVDDALNNKKV